MASDMDIDMDIDIGLSDDLVVQSIDATPDIDLVLEPPRAILGAPNDTADSNYEDLVPQKIHLRGLDNLTTDDIKAFASEYFESHKPVHIEWIDDTSANLVYESTDIALQALQSFAAADISDLFQLPVLQTIQAKAFPTHPETNLQIRRAVVGDRKQAGARERSRFYLFNPEYDPAERRKRTARGPKKYRDRDDGGYRSQRYDDYEQRKRERDADFDASLYDDDETTIAQRRARNQRASLSGIDLRGQEPGRSRPRRDSRKELFPEQRDSRILRDRSASPLRDSAEDHEMAELRDKESRQNSSAAAANRAKAQMIKAQLKESSSRELFPQKSGRSHRRSDAFDAADETADLFAHRMAVPFVDGPGDPRSRNSGSLVSRLTRVTHEDESSTSFKICGIAKTTTSTSQNFNIKGAASGVRVKELFPSTLGDNAGKELFSERLEGRRTQRRQKAEDLFY